MLYLTFIFSPGSLHYSDDTDMSQVGVALFPSFQLLECLYSFSRNFLSATLFL